MKQALEADTERLLRVYRRWQILQLHVASRRWWQTFTWRHTSFLALAFALLLAAPLDAALLGWPLAGDFLRWLPRVSAWQVAAAWAIDSCLIARLLERRDARLRPRRERLASAAVAGVPLFGFLLLPRWYRPTSLARPPAAAPPPGGRYEAGEPWSHRIESWLRRFETSPCWLAWIVGANFLIVAGFVCALADAEGWPRPRLAAGVLSALLHAVAFAALRDQVSAAAGRARGPRRALLRALPSLALLPALLALLPALWAASSSDRDGRARLVDAAFGRGSSLRRLPLWSALGDELARRRARASLWRRWWFPAAARPVAGGEAVRRVHSLARIGRAAGFSQWALAGALAGSLRPGNADLRSALGGCALMLLLGSIVCGLLALLLHWGRAAGFALGWRSRPAASSTAPELILAGGLALGGFGLGVYYARGGPQVAAVLGGLGAAGMLLVMGFAFLLAVPLRRRPPPLPWVVVTGALSALCAGIVVDPEIGLAATRCFFWFAVSSPLWCGGAGAATLPWLLRSHRGGGPQARPHPSPPRWRGALLIATTLLPTGGFAAPLWLSVVRCGSGEGASPGEP